MQNFDRRTRHRKLLSFMKQIAGGKPSVIMVDITKDLEDIPIIQIQTPHKQSTPQVRTSPGPVARPAHSSTAVTRPPSRPSVTVDEERQFKLSEPLQHRAQPLQQRTTPNSSSSNNSTVNKVCAKIVSLSLWLIFVSYTLKYLNSSCKTKVVWTLVHHTYLEVANADFP